MKSLLSAVVVGVLCLVSAHAEKDIPPGAPAGSCCRLDGKEGASQWSKAANAWTCKLDSKALPKAPARTAEGREALYQDQLQRAGNPNLYPNGQPIKKSNITNWDVAAQQRSGPIEQPNLIFNGDVDKTKGLSKTKGPSKTPEKQDK